MNPEYTEIDWVAERLPEAPEPDELATARARQSLMMHVADPARDTDLVVETVASHPRWRPRGLRLGVVGAGIAAAAFIGINLTGTSGSSGGPAVASAANIKKQVIAMLQPPLGSIQEVKEVLTGTNQSVRTYQVWSQLAGDQASRIVQTSSNGTSSEDEDATDFQEIYNPTDNTIYRLNHSGPGNFIGQFTGQIINQLQDPNSVVDSSASFQGQPAVKITTTTSGANLLGTTFNTQFVTYFKAGTYQPLGSTQSTIGTQDGQQISSFQGTSTFPIWRTLTGSAASPKLVSLSAQHPTAVTKVVDNQEFNQVDRQAHPNG
jgi:hypothetical protein